MLFTGDRPGQPWMLDLPARGSHRPHDNDFRIIEFITRQAEHEEHLFLGEEVGDRILGRGHPLDQPLGHRHGQRLGDAKQALYGFPDTNLSMTAVGTTRLLARVGPTTPKHRARDLRASVDPTEAR